MEQIKHVSIFPHNKIVADNSTFMANTPKLGAEVKSMVHEYPYQFDHQGQVWQKIQEALTQDPKQ